MKRSQPQQAILLTLLDAHQRKGAARLPFRDLVRSLGMPKEHIEEACFDLVREHLAVCTPVDGPPDVAALTVLGMREARRVLGGAKR